MSKLVNSTYITLDGAVENPHTWPSGPTKSGDPYSDKINAMEKLVASTTLRDPEWNNTTVIDDDLVGEITRRKERGGDIVQYGFGEVSRTLLDAGLIDELRLWVHPLLVGSGTADDLLFRDGTTAQLELADVDRLASGIVILTYPT
jgi:dihydrofolate reductase